MTQNKPGDSNDDTGFLHKLWTDRKNHGFVKLLQIVHQLI